MKRTFLVPVVMACALTLLPQAPVSAAEGLSDNVIAQIQALHEEKAARTPAQIKLDSSLLYSLRRSRGQTFAAVPALKAGAKVDANGRVEVDIQAVVTPDLLNYITTAGGTVLNSVSQFRAVRAIMPVSQLEALAARADVRSVKAAVKAITNAGSVTSQGDVTHAAAFARQFYGVTGGGVKVGVLSDSVDYLLNSQNSGDLPANLVVLPGQSGVPASGEGTAMLEIVHDLAPGSQLYFASAFGGAAQFAQNILDLRAAGCDIIIDDVFYFNESPFQDGIIAQAVNTVTANGAMFFSSAGNSGNLKQGTSGTWEGNFVDGGAITITGGTAKSGRIHNFGPATFNTVTGFGNATTLFWSDPLAASTNDYDLYVLDATANTIVDASTTIQNGTQDPYEIVNPPFPGERIVVVKYSGADRFLHIDTIRGQLSVATAGNIKGHSATTNALSVAAIDVATVYPSQFVAGPAVRVEDFSSDGNRRVFYHSDGQPITPGQFLAPAGGSVRSKPDITAADGVVTTLPPTSGLNPFFGTSAAAPHAGAIAALVKSYNPLLNAQQVINILTNTALDIEDAGFDTNSGMGVVMANRAIAATPSPSLTVVGRTFNDGNGNRVVEPNECVDLYVTVRNDTPTNFVGGLALLTTTTPGITIVQPAFTFPTLLQGQSFTNATPFKFSVSPDFACGVVIDFSLIISNQNRLRTNLIQVPTGLVGLIPALLNNNAGVPIADGDTNGVESVINVAGVSGAVGKVTVALHVSHPAAGELGLQLIGPDGSVVTLAQNRGFAGPGYGTACFPATQRTTFDDNAPGTIVVAASPFVGSFRPEQSLGVFAGKSGAAVNGAWRLRVVDSATNNIGAIQCWTLSLFPSICADGGGVCVSDFAVAAATAPVPALVGSNVTYTFSVTNTRPLASPVSLASTLPAGVAYVGSGASQGSATFSNGVVQFAFGVLGIGSNAVGTVTVVPPAAGFITNSATLSAAADVNPANNSITVVTAVANPAPVVVADGAQLVGDASGGIEAGETVTVSLALRNVGSAPTANLVATLLDGGGVSGSSGSQNYGVIGLGASVARAFTFTAPGQAGDTVSAVLQLQDGIENLGTVTFHFTLGGEITFQDGAPIVINQFGPATPYPAIINVSGVAGLVSKVRVTFTKLSHTFPDDIDALLVGPAGQKLVLMSDSGGGNAIANRTITFDDAASSLVPNETILSAGSYRPGNYDSGTEPGGDVFPAPAPAGSLSSTLAAFNGGSPNGLWSLYIHDDGGNDGGSVSGGWALGISVIVPVIPLSDLSITASAAPNPAIVGEDLTYTLTVANAGPSNAPSVVVTDVIPAGSTFVSAAASQGTASEAAGVVTASLGTINSGASATLTIVVRPVSTGAQVNQASVSAAVTDLNAANNAVSTSVPASNPVADLALHVTAHPESVFVSSNVTFHIVVTNQGPNHADAIQVTNRLAGAFALVSATNSQGACSFVDGVITCDFGSLAAHGSATATIVATAVSPGASANLFAIVSPTLDPAPANNVTNVVSVINPLAPLFVAAGAALTSESGVPANGAIESGEVVTVSFGLRNVGTADAGNLVATLLATGGVSSPGGSQIYGAMPANGSTVSRPFSFTASAAAGGTLTATLQLQDGLQDLGTVAFSFNVSASRTFTNSDVIIIPLAGKATNYPSTITVAGVTGAVSRVTVSIRQFTHTFPEDVDMLLVGPAGQKVMLMSDAGAGNGVNGISLTFDDTAVNLPFANTIASGTYRGTDFPPGDTLPAPAPAGPYGTNLAVFKGVNPNGTWSLYVFDDANGDAGRIDGGWTINIQTATPIVSSADISVTATAPATVVPGSSFGYTIHVANHGPAAASGVVLTDTLPAGFTLSSVAVSQGSYTTGAGLVTANLGNLAVGATATVAINGSTTVGLTNVLQVTAAPVDGYLANNSVSVVTLLIPPSLAAQLSGANVIISWPAPSTGYVLESSLNANGPWAPAGLPVTVVGGQNQVTVPAVGTTFYRLAKP